VLLAKQPQLKPNRHSLVEQVKGTIMIVEHLNPDTLNQNPAFTNVITVSGSAKTVYIGGQNSVDSSGTIIGKGNFKVQVEKIYENLQTALSAAGAKLEHIVKWNIYIVQGQDLRVGFEVFQRVWGKRPNPPVITAVIVAGLANPDFLAEMDAIAVIPE
jgi:enamine deaminase RidA (YjgF/YER057c/UK114 family)